MLLVSLVIQVSVDIQVVLGTLVLVSADIQDSQVFLVTQDSQVYQDILEHLEHLAILDGLVSVGTLVNLDSQVILVSLVTQDSQESVDLVDILGFQDILAFLV